MYIKYLVRAQKYLHNKWVGMLYNIIFVYHPSAESVSDTIVENIIFLRLMILKEKKKD